MAGESAPRSFSIRTDEVTVGRSPSCDVVVDLPWVSLHQATLRRDGATWNLEPVSGATTPVFHNGEELLGTVNLAPIDYFRVAGPEAGQMVTCVLIPREEVQQAAAQADVLVELGQSVLVGSSRGAGVGAGNPTLNDEHLRITRTDGGWQVEPLDGASVRVGGQVIEQVVVANAGETIAAGSIRLTLAEAAISWRDAGAALVVPRRRARELPADLWDRVAGKGGVLLEAFHLRRDIKEHALLDDLSLRVRPRQLVVIVGLSGAGKSTLLNALSGYRSPTSGEVRVDGTSLYDNIEHFRSVVGFVPQKDIVHSKLTVAEALDYAARLRLPGASEDERASRVNEVLDALGLRARRDVLIEQLSGGQVKRVSIGVELISRPQLLFLDEPTSGLDPVTETGLMLLLRRLADQGRTVVLITHATKNVMLADNVLFMVPGGRVAWYGPPGEAVDYFDEFRTPTERADREIEFDEIYQLLEDPERGSPQQWAERYRGTPAFQTQVNRPLRLDSGGTAPSASPLPHVPRPSFLQQFIALSARNLKLISRDRFALVLMIVAAPLLAGLDFLITERKMFDPLVGDTSRIITNTNTLIVNAMLVAALAQMREIIKDREIYRRERLVNLRIAPYILSKVWIAGLLAVYQAAWWVGIRYLAVDMPGGFSDASGIYLTVLLVTFAGMMLGLFASAAAPSEDSVALIVALLIVPQVLFSGAHLPAHKLNPMVRAQMDIMPSRWAFEALITQGGHGQDVADDACWQLPEGEREALTAEQKQGCDCMGESVFSACNFPGIRKYESAVQGGIDAGLDEDAALAQAVASAESRLAHENDYYGRIWDINVLTRWVMLLVISASLVAIILAIQHVRGRLA